jgi:hypothetical protein
MLPGVAYILPLKDDTRNAASWIQTSSLVPQYWQYTASAEEDFPHAGQIRAAGGLASLSFLRHPTCHLPGERGFFCLPGLLASLLVEALSTCCVGLLNWLSASASLPSPIEGVLVFMMTVSPGANSPLICPIANLFCLLLPNLGRGILSPNFRAYSLPLLKAWVYNARICAGDKFFPVRYQPRMALPTTYVPE